LFLISSFLVFGSWFLLFGSWFLVLGSWFCQLPIAGLMPIANCQLLVLMPSANCHLLLVIGFGATCQLLFANC
jgi:hypothetical protein